MAVRAAGLGRHWPVWSGTEMGGFQLVRFGAAMHEIRHYRRSCSRPVAEGRKVRCQAVEFEAKDWVGGEQTDCFEFRGIPMRA